MITIRVVLIDDHKVVIEGCKSFLEHEDDIMVVGTATTGIEALELVGRMQPDVVVLDVEMPHMDGVTVTQQLRRFDPSCRVLLFTAHNNHQYVAEGLRAGALGYVIKDAARYELVKAIRTIARNERYLHDAVVPTLFDVVQHTPVMVSTAGDQSLTDREREVLGLIATGLTTEAIASHLSLSAATVKAHVRHILAKLNVPSRQEAVVEARRRNWLR